MENKKFSRKEIAQLVRDIRKVLSEVNSSQQETNNFCWRVLATWKNRK
jgi:hypothetical protein